MGQVSGIRRKAFNSVLSGKKYQDGEISTKEKKIKVQNMIRNKPGKRASGSTGSFPGWFVGPKPFCTKHRWI